jgi:hypothetical protein
MSNLRLALLSFFAWAIAIFFGAVVFNTVVLYPNIFRHVPQSLELTMEFLQVRGPHHFFPPFGAMLILVNLVLVALWWRTRQVRNLLAVGVLLIIVFEFIFSVTFFWDKNTIMFIEGQRVHSIGFLESTAESFQRWHWLRVITTGTASALIFIAHMRSLRGVGKRWSGEATEI